MHQPAQNPQTIFKLGRSASRPLIYFGASLLVIVVAITAISLLEIKFLSDNIPLIIIACFGILIIAYIMARNKDRGLILEIKNGYAEFKNGGDMSLKCAIPIKELKISPQHWGDPKDTTGETYTGPGIKFENHGISDITIITSAQTLTWKNPKKNNYIGMNNYSIDKKQWINLIHSLGLTNELNPEQKIDHAKIEAMKKNSKKLIIGFVVFVILFYILVAIIRYYNIPVD